MENLTRTLGKFLQRWGVDAEQYHYLLQASLKLDFRSGMHAFKKGESNVTKSALKWTLGMNLVFTFLMSMSFLLTGPNTYVFSVMLLGYSIVMLAMSILIEFGLVVISPDDYTLLAHRPISSRTFFAVKVSNLLFYIALLSLSFGVVPAFGGLACSGSRWYFPFVYLFVSLVTSLFVAGAIVGLYGLMLRRVNYEKFKDLLVYCQVAFSFLFFFGYQAVPRFAGELRNANVDDLAYSWGVLFPSLWFAAIIELFLGHFSVEAAALSAAALIGLAAVLPLLFKSVSLDYADQIGRLMSASSKGQPPKTARFQGLWRRLPHLLLGNVEERAFFTFFLAMLRRNRQLKLQLYPNFGMVIAMLALVILQKEKLADPFVERSVRSATTLPIMAFLVSAMGFTTQLPYSDEFQGGWIFTIAPIRDRKRILTAIKKAIVLLLFVPLFLLNAILFSFFWPISHAVQQSLYAFSVGLLGLQILLFFFRDFPFSRKLEKGAQSRNLVAVFLAFSMIGFAVVLPLLFSASQLAFLIITASLLALSLLLGHLNNRLYATRTIEVPG